MKRDVRQHIIATASDLFYRNGYNSTGINEIISESGIAKATLYNHFKSKEDICLAYLQHKHNKFTHDIKAFCSSKSSGEDQVLAVFDFLSLFFKEKDFNGCWCIKTVSEIPKDNERIRNEIQSQKKQLIAFISELITKNLTIVSEKESESLAKQIYLLYESAVAESHLHQENWPIMQAKNICQKIV
ncbi:TetR/AcrR family transcriptional regulator [Tenacibaculum jejuense]|uniref:TetR/AcrR family transcriptional regulator n=1 Tax=Tenacibaculum jejuense TaxID=584609 RepID=UPI0018D5A7AE|nr:TetR/AcrR family transcriptional regulator [Tenacibaculum jejuense]